MEKQKILIVDDSEMNRDLLMDILEDQYDVVEAANGVEAISILSERREDFSLMLLDIMMPEMDGFEVLARINKNHWNENLAVIIISADDSSENIKHAYDLGAFDYINRPFDAEIVQRRVYNTICLFARQQRLEKIIEKKCREQEKSNNMMISILANVVEFRNGESGSHILHVNVITEALLRQLVRNTNQYSLSKETISLITTASALHDIGKISIPDEILNKPGRLTAEEFELMKTHSAIGANMLLNLPAEQHENPLIKIAMEVCRWHHERYDGNGYPDGLKGDEIPISAQVVALADVYEALISERCYKKAYSHEEAMRMILDGQCGAFNPVLLSCLQDIADTLEYILTEASNEQEAEKIWDIKNVIDDYELSKDKEPTFLYRKQRRQHLLYVDPLTNIYNRRYYEQYVQDTEDIQSMVVIDVDNFKSINDNYGHDIGDRALQSIAQTISSYVRRTDAVIRYGGDEFVVIFNRIPAEVFGTKLEKIRQSIESLRLDYFPELQMSVSIGGAYGIGSTTKLFKIADNMMYKAKEKRNRVEICFLEN